MPLVATEIDFLRTLYKQIRRGDLNASNRAETLTALEKCIAHLVELYGNERVEDGIIRYAPLRRRRRLGHLDSPPVERKLDLDESEDEEDFDEPA